MLNSILSRNRKARPYNALEFEIVRAATKLFLENGYSNTTMKMISKEASTGLGNITYYFHSKDDLLLLLVEELMDFHSDMIEKVLGDTNDSVFAYSSELVSQIALCEIDDCARDIYYSAYSCPGIIAFIKEWGAKKNYTLLKDRLPDWTRQDFINRENIAAFIEFSAIASRCDNNFSLEEKITLTLDSLISLYQIPTEERKAVIDKILTFDNVEIGKSIFEQFVDKFKKSADGLTNH